jgi:hypothetical protein
MSIIGVAAEKSGGDRADLSFETRVVTSPIAAIDH